MLRFAGERLHAIRVQAGMTQYALMKACDLGLASVTRWENNITTPNLIEVYKIARFFKVPMEYFVIDGDKDTKNK